MGAAVGAIFFPHDPLVQIGCLAGAVIPDMPMVILYGIDKILKRPPMKTQTPIWIFAKNVCQSGVIWAIIAFLGWHYWNNPVGPILLGLGVNGFVHVVVDYYTHGSPVFSENDGYYTWPFNVFKKHVGWDYRISTGQLWPLKRPEAVVFVLASYLTVLGWWPW